MRFPVFKKKAEPGPAPEQVSVAKAPPRDDDIDISIIDIFRAVLSGWWIVALFLVLAVAYGVNTVRKATPVYTASAQIVPTDRPAVGPRQTGGGLGAVFGLAVGGASSGPFGRFADMLASYSLAQRLDQKYGLLRVMYESSWDEETQSWKVPPPRKLDGLRDWIGLPRPTPPSLLKLQGYLAGGIEFGTGGGSLGGRPSEVTTITFNNADPVFAKWLLETAIREADQLLRENEMARARARISSIEQQLSTTSTEVSRQVLLALLEEQYQKLTIASSNSSYYVEMFDPVQVSEAPTYPKPMLTIQLSVIVGLGLGIVAALIFRFRRLAFGRKAREIALYTS